MDEETLLASVRKTGRPLGVQKASGLCGVAAELAAIAAGKAFEALRATVARLTGPDAPAASSRVLERTALPQRDAVVRTATGLVQGRGEAAPHRLSSVGGSR